ncbi:MAG: hypothetical protein Q9186_001765 [Xanthomendoza sp. 1 TL-2023]
MAPPESEWMLWAMRLKTTVRADLDQEVRSLHARFADLQQASASVDALRAQQIEDLTASNEHLHHTNLSLRNRIQELDSQCVIRDRDFATGSKLLQEATTNLARQVEDVVEGLTHFKKDATAAEEKHQLEIQALRKQIEASVPKTDADKQVRTGSKTFSEATTIDDGPDESIGTAAAFYHTRQSDWSISQGNATFQEYLTSGESFVRKFEAEAVKAYVEGINLIHRRKQVRDSLEEKGWTWENARHEVQLIIDEGKRRLRKRRQPPPLKMDG